jgi:hypothetical protein
VEYATALAVKQEKSHLKQEKSDLIVFPSPDPFYIKGLYLPFLHLPFLRRK